LALALSSLSMLLLLFSSQPCTPLAPLEASVAEVLGGPSLSSIANLRFFPFEPFSLSSLRVFLRFQAVFKSIPSFGSCSLSVDATLFSSRGYRFELPILAFQVNVSDELYLAGDPRDDSRMEINVRSKFKDLLHQINSQAQTILAQADTSLNKGQLSRSSS
jgi:hypothetical protein